jgi:hypothetical protein
MDKKLKILLMIFVLTCIVFSAGCTGNSQSTENPTQGTPYQNANPHQENGYGTPNHRLHMNSSERPYWNNTSGRTHLNGSERLYWNNSSIRPHFNGSMKPYWNDSGNVT